MQLRKYQSDIIDAAKAALARSGSVVLQMPTGAGKTKTATEIVRQETGVVWVVVHRRELVRQTSKAFASAGLEFGVVSAGKCAETGKKYPLEPHKRIQIISIGSLSAKRCLLPDPDLVVWDECHHLAAKSWADIRESLTSARHLGLTATPERFDGAGLRNWFAELVCGPPIPKLVPEYLSPYIYFAPSSPDLAAAKLRAGDYRAEDAARAMSAPVIIGDAIREYKEKADGKRAIAFCVTTDASRDLVERFNSEGIPAVHVDAKTKDDVRLAAVNDLASGRIKVLSNVEVFTEGVDIPEVDAAILMRPTKSPTLFLQMIGRVLRKSAGKDRAIIFDHAGLIEDHGKLSDPWEWSIDGGAAMRRREASTGFRKCPKCKHCPDDREPVCSNCGHEYETGREIGVYDGVLRVVDEGVPEGCETQTDLARRYGVTTACVHGWMKRGLPSRGVYPLSAESEVWIKKNGKIIPVGCETMASFARRNGFSAGAVTEKLIAKGLPVRDGYPVLGAADEWLEGNEDEVIRIKAWGRAVKARMSEGRPEGSINKTEFCSRYGFSNFPSSLLKQGMPRSGSFFFIEEIESWMAKNSSAVDAARTRSASQSKRPAGMITRSEYARSKGVGLSALQHWTRKGFLPTHSGLLCEAEVDDFIARNVDPSTGKLYPASGRNFVEGYRSRATFGRYIGLWAKGLSKLIDSGLPYDPKLGIPIREGLEWVRDNRPDIVIPPEAWPKD